jgi:hypothetical protein
MSEDEKKARRQLADESGLLRPKTQLSFYKNTAKEFPLPFNFGPGHLAQPPNPADRRRMERKERNQAKRMAARRG